MDFTPMHRLIAVLLFPVALCFSVEASAQSNCNAMDNADSCQSDVTADSTGDDSAHPAHWGAGLVTLEEQRSASGNSVSDANTSRSWNSELVTLEQQSAEASTQHERQRAINAKSTDDFKNQYDRYKSGWLIDWGIGWQSLRDFAVQFGAGYIVPRDFETESLFFFEIYLEAYWGWSFFALYVVPKLVLRWDAISIDLGLGFGSAVPAEFLDWGAKLSVGFKYYINKDWFIGVTGDFVMFFDFDFDGDLKLSADILLKAGYQF